MAQAGLPQDEVQADTIYRVFYRRKEYTLELLVDETPPPAGKNAVKPREGPDEARGQPPPGISMAAAG